MLRSRLIVLFTLCLGITAGLIMGYVLSAQAQTGLSDRQPEPNNSGLPAGRGPADPPPAGYTVYYLFSGAVTTPQVATTVHCTNAGSSIIDVMVELADFDNLPVYTGTAAMGSNTTFTFSTANTGLYSDDVIIDTAGDVLNQGSGRVMANSPTAKLLCTAQTLDVANPPTYVVNLELFTPQE